MPKVSFRMASASREWVFAEAAGALTARHPVFHRGLARIGEAVAPPIDRLRRDAVAAGGLGNRGLTRHHGSTICSRVSTGTGSLDLLKIVSPSRPRPENLPVIFTH